MTKKFRKFVMHIGEQKKHFFRFKSENGAMKKMLFTHEGKHNNIQTATKEIQKIYFFSALFFAEEYVRHLQFTNN